MVRAQSIIIPARIESKLGDMRSGVLEYQGAVSRILSDNKLPFFPNYTDHGLRHIDRILDTISRHLIPEDVWADLTEEDAAVLVCAAMIHDLAMHMRELGFLSLIRGGQLPLQEFDKSFGPIQADLPWPEEWVRFRSRVRRFGDHELIQVLGRIPAREDLRHWFVEELPDDPLTWSAVDYLLVGEFIRTYHGRLAHEIAVYGFPGLSSDEFPTLVRLVPKIADIAGLVARSHSLPLRDAADCVWRLYPKDLRPRGVALLYHMALLRIADYLQLDSERAPRILFRLRFMDVPPSVDEWNKHGAIAAISYVLDDPAAIKIELGSKHSFATHLQTRKLIAGLQAEIDVASAVLSENYGRVTESGLSRFRLSKLRVHSNHDDPDFIRKLLFIPEALRLDADPQILGLMVEPIYGHFPHFGVRELLQNAVDAVLERRHYCSKRGAAQQLRAEDGEDVLVELEGDADQGWVIHFLDRGIGMTVDTIRHYFLRAGASFRNSQNWREEFSDIAGGSAVRRSGRFGVGVFAGFLLGDTLEVVTKHVEADDAIQFCASIDSGLIELRKVKGQSIGTSIRIRLPSRLGEFAAEGWRHCVDWYGLEEPRVRFRRKSGKKLVQGVSAAVDDLCGRTRGWNFFQPDGFEGVAWSSAMDGERGSVYCNGFLIGAPDRENGKIVPAKYHWPHTAFDPPLLFISDHDGALPLTLRRDRLFETLSFIDELVADILLDVMAWCLVFAPEGPVWESDHLGSYRNRYPLLSSTLHWTTFRWACSSEGVLPLDRSLLRQLGIQTLVAAGIARLEESRAYMGREQALIFGSDWKVEAPPNGRDTLAFVMPEDGGRFRGSFDEVTMDRSEPKSGQRTIEEKISDGVVRYIARARGGGEFSVFGAVALMHGRSEGCTELRAGESIEVNVNLADMLGPPPPRTRYFSWRTEEVGGVEQVNVVRRERFVAQLGVSPCEGDSVLSRVWNLMIGLPLLPFDSATRASIVSAAIEKHGLGPRIHNWNEVKRRKSKSVK